MGDWHYRSYVHLGSSFRRAVMENILKVTCQGCGHKQEIKMNLPMPVDAAVKILNEARCENCGSKELAI